MNHQVFYSSLTGKLMHRVPVGATIPAGTTFGWIDPYGVRRWVSAAKLDFTVDADTYPCWTAGPIAPPVPSLPTEVSQPLDLTSGEADALHSALMEMSQPPGERIADAIEAEEDRLRRLTPGHDDWQTPDFRMGMLHAAAIVRSTP